MKRTMIFLTVLCALTANAQWSLSGNSGTNPPTNFLGTADNKDLVFKTNNLERMKIDNNGNLFFATNNLEGAKTFYSTISNRPDSFIIQDASSNWNYMRIASSDEYDSTIYFQENSGRVAIGTNSIVDSESNFGYKLFVKNGIKTEKVKVEIATENGWADYVFNDDYKLMPLKELGNYIAENKHLPEVPTTEEAIKNGIELKEMNILLLKKIEELTLHIIAQDKRLENLEKSKN